MVLLIQPLLSVAELVWVKSWYCCYKVFNAKYAYVYLQFYLHMICSSYGIPSYALGFGAVRSQCSSRYPCVHIHSHTQRKNGAYCNSWKHYSYQIYAYVCIHMHILSFICIFRTVHPSVRPSISRSISVSVSICLLSLCPCILTGVYISYEVLF